MNLPDSVLLRKYHLEKMRLHGAHSTRALGWETAFGQKARFDALAECLGDLTGKSILDAGCGHGDFRGYLDSRFEGLRYAGVDMIDEFLDIAIERYSHYPETSFYAGNFLSSPLPVMDFIIASGSLNYRSADPDFVFKTISNLFQKCRCGLVFNLLRNTSVPMGMLVGYDPEVILAHCRKLSEKVEFRDGYYGEDYTIGLFRGV
ncbi:MAG: class I SAM-dependent methyltransferase [Bacteroidetes bacterium]|nr:class I SAM-dependent methyltransferase [Bacteroidota bacterium]